MDELVRRNRAAFRASVDAFLAWGWTPEERAAHDAEDAAYFKQRAAEFAAEDQATRESMADERIYERQRARDRAFS